jgi:integrase
MPPSLQTLYEEATKENTRLAYQYDIKCFEREGALPCDEAAVLHYIQQRAASISPQTLQRHILSVRRWHQTQGLADPTQSIRVKKALRGALNKYAKEPKKAEALTESALLSMVDYLHDQPGKRAVRNRALLLLGFYAACRRSELARFTWEDLSFVREGLVVRFVDAKGDSTKSGQRCSIPAGKDKAHCALQALLEWQQVSGFCIGPVFREIYHNDRVGEKPIKGEQVGNIIKATAKICAIPNAGNVSAHSLRRGFATEAFRRGASLNHIKKHGRWKSLKTVMEYLEEARLFVDSPVSVFFS